MLSSSDHVNAHDHVNVNVHNHVNMNVHDHAHGHLHYLGMKNNHELAIRGFVAIFVSVAMFVMCEYNFVFIAFNYFDRKCIDHWILILIGLLNLCEVIISLFVFYNSLRIIQYLKDLIISLKTYGGCEIDAKNNLNPTKIILQHVGFFYMFFILIEFIPSLLISSTINNQCANYWTLDWTKIVFIVFRIIIIIVGIALFIRLFLLGFKFCLRNLTKKYIQKSSDHYEERMIR